MTCFRMVFAALVLSSSLTSCTEAAPEPSAIPTTPGPTPSAGLPRRIATIPILEDDPDIHPGSFAFDPINRRILVTVYCTADVCDASRDGLWVIDANTNKVIRRLSIPRIDQVAVHAAAETVYLTVRDGGVLVLDAETLMTKQRISVPNASWIAADLRSGHLYLADYDSEPQALRVLDVKTGQIISRIPTAGAVEATDGSGVLYTASDSNSILAVDSSTRRIVRTFATGWDPDAFDVDLRTGSLYVAGGYNETTGEFMEQLKIFSAAGELILTSELDLHPVDIVVDPVPRRLYVLETNSDGAESLRVLDSTNGSRITVVKDAPAFALLFDPVARMLYGLGIRGVVVFDVG